MGKDVEYLSEVMTDQEKPAIIMLQNLEGNSNGDVEINFTPSTETQVDEKYHESNAGDGSRAIDQHLTGLPLILTLISCVVSLFVAALDATIVTTIQTQVGNQFQSFDKIGWLTTGYLLPMATLTPSYGKVSIAFGRKNVALIGILIFEIGSLICALSNSMDMIIGGRVIQGIGGGAIQSMVSVILTESVPINKRPLLFMLIALTYSLASVLGPFVGGALALHVSWRWCFYINLPIGAVASAMLYFSFNPPKTKGNFKEKLLKIDYLGTFLIAAGLVLFLLGLTFGGVDYPWKSPAVILCFVLGILLLGVFSLWNFKYSKSPILLKELVTNREVVASCLAGLFNYSFFLAGLTYLAAYFQIIFNASAWSSGIHLLPVLVTVTIASFSNGLFIKATSMVKPTLIFSCILGPLGTGLFLVLDVDSLNGQKIGLIIVFGILAGLMFQLSMISTQLAAPQDIEGSIILVTIFLTFVRTIAASIAVTICQLIFQTTGVKYIEALVLGLPKDSNSYEILSGYAALDLISSPELIQSLEPQTKKLVLAELMKSFWNIFYFLLALLVLGLISGLFSTNKRIPTDVATKEKVSKVSDVSNNEKNGEDYVDVNATSNSLDSGDVVPENKSSASVDEYREIHKSV